MRADDLRFDAGRIAFMSDTHFMAEDGSDVPQQLLAALQGVGLIVHLGHVSSASALDRLQEIAPLVAVQTELDGQLLGPALAGEVASGRMRGRTRVIDVAGTRIGIVHDLAAAAPGIEVGEDGHVRFRTGDIAPQLSSAFGDRVDAVAFAATHIDFVAFRGGVLFLNPGSPNLPAGRRKEQPGTVIIMDAGRDGVQLQVVEVDCR
jgi:putative phosphoesterase